MAGLGRAWISCAGTARCVGGSVVCKDAGSATIYGSKDCGTCCKCTGGSLVNPSAAYDGSQDADCWKKDCGSGYVDRECGGAIGACTDPSCPAPAGCGG